MSRPKHTVSPNDPPENASSRGPGTLQKRIDRIKRTLSKPEVEKATKLATDVDYETLRLAHYLSTVKHEATTKAQRIEMYQRYLARLSAETAAK